MALEFTGAAAPLTGSGLTRATQRLQVGGAEVRAVLKVETSGCGFLSDRRPQILFERHIFRRKIQGRAADKVSPDTTPAAKTGAVSGTVRRGGAAVANASLAVVGQPTLKCQADGNGAYVINSVPVGERAIEASDPAGAKLTRVAVEAGKATTCQIDL